MLKKIMNEAFLTVRITTTGPLLIKSGHETVYGPNMTPVLTFRNNQQEVFIPGGSLKGVFRSHAERVVGSLKSHVICYPFAVEADKETDQEQRKRDYRESCGEMFNKIAKKNNDDKGEQRKKHLDARKDIVYAASCPICRLFGSTSFIGRIAINDAYLAPGTNKTHKELRDGVGIDRLTGGASDGAKFDLQVVTTGVVFETDIHLRNFELWQLGMLFIVLQDMEHELISLGSGRSRGLGKVKAEIVMQDRPLRQGGVVISTIRDAEASEPTKELWGLGRWLDEGRDKPMPDDKLLGLSFPGNGSYGTWRDDRLILIPEVEQSTLGIRLQRAFKNNANDDAKDDALTALRAATIDHFIRRMKAWPTQPQLEVINEAKR